MLGRFVIDHLNVFDLVIGNDHYRFLNLWKAVLPSVAARVVAVEVSDCLKIAFRRSLCRSASFAAAPFELLADMVIDLFDQSGSKSDTGAHHLSAHRTLQFVIDCVCANHFFTFNSTSPN